MKYDYPAIFYDDDGQVAFRFYDADWFSCGENIADAIEMAEDVLNGRLMRLERDGGQIPTPTPIEKISLKPFEVLRIIHADTDRYASELAKQQQREAILLEENPVKYLRELTGLTLKQFADELDAPYRTVQDWNAGVSKPPKWAIPLLVDKFLN